MTAPRAKSSGSKLAPCNTWLQKSALMATASHCMASVAGLARAIKTIHEADFGIAQRSDDVQQKIGGHKNIGVADDDDIVFGLALELNEARNLAVDAQRFRTNDKRGIGPGMLLEQLADDGAGWIVRGGHAKEHLNWRGVILGKPASQATHDVGIQAFKRFKDGYGRREGFIDDAAMEGEAHCCNPLPHSNYHTNDGESLQNSEHPTFVNGAGRLSKRQLLRNWPNIAKFALTATEGIDYKTLESKTSDQRAGNNLILKPFMAERLC